MPLAQETFMGNTTDAEFVHELEAMMQLEFFPHLTAAAEPTGHHAEDFAPKNFLYRPLTGEEEIRLLLLEFGTTGALKGKLLHVKLGDNPAFEALSYSWGPLVKTHEISLPEGIIRITKSLFTSLACLRRRQGGRRLIWIDQLCINQDDNEEKCHQILLMPRIYSSALRVLAWLGEDEGNGSIAFRLLEKIGRTDTSSLSKRSISAAWMRANDLPASGDSTWFAFLAFWSRPWFRRIWIVQEFILAKDVLMICGEAELSWKTLTSAHEKMMQYSLLDWGTYGNYDINQQKEEAFSGSMSLRVMMEIKHASKLGSSIANTVRSFSERDSTGLEELLVGNWGKIPGIKEMVMMLREMPEAIGPMTEIIGQCFETFVPEAKQIRLPLCDLLILFGKSDSSDPRDRLFSLLGLAADGDDESLRPNYDESVESVFLRYANYFVKNGDGMKLLYQAVGVSNKETIVPSWVPDWTKPDLLAKRVINLPAYHGLLYKAAADTPPQIRMADNRSEIVISGGYIDKVARVAINHLGDLGAVPNSHYFLKFRNFFKEADSFILHRKSYITSEPLVEVQWKTLIGNCSGETSLVAPEEYGQQYYICRQMIEELKTEGPFPHLDDMNSYCMRLFAVINRCKLCETQTGLVGMVPLDTIVGDSIYIFNGGRIPFILRSVSAVERKYRMVGGCYIHGIMDGEAILSDTWTEENVTLQ